MKNRFVSIVWKVIFLCGCAYGIALNAGLNTGVFAPQAFLYFTILSNLICFCFASFELAVTIANKDQRTRYKTLNRYSKAKGACIVVIMLTFLVYHFILRPTAFQMTGNLSPSSPANLLVYYFSPGMFFLDWLLFSAKGRFGWLDPFAWLGLPLFYLIFALIRAQFGGQLSLAGGKYPYFFMNVEALGMEQFLRNIAGIALGIVILGYLLVLADKGLYRLAGREKAVKKES